MPDVRLSRYQVMETLGHGSQGHTYRGIDRASGDEVAIKVISLRQLQDWKGFDLFERECKVLARLSHAGIPRFIDHYASEESGDYFLVMGLAPGRTLRALQDAGEGFSPARLRALLDQALDILGYLHEQSPPVIHRDIKPSNMLWSTEGRLSLVDFGGVRAAFQDEGGSTMIGTFGFMAPEQLHGDATPATDIFALGATIVALASGRDPEDLPRKGLAIDLQQVLPAHPLRAVLEQMLAPDPAQRLQDAAAVRAALDDAEPAPASAPRGPSAPRKPKVAPKRVPKTQALVERDARVPAQIRELAATESRFLRVFLWLFASLGSGALVLVEAVLMPLFFQLSKSWKRDEDSLAQLEAQHEDTLSTLRQSRHDLRYLAKHTHPADEG